MIAHIAEVDARRLYARHASPSMFAYCTEVLHFSEAEAYLRITAARASRKHPMLLSMLAEGRLHLSGIAKLAPQLTLENRDALLEQAAHRTKREIVELLAALSPKPDVRACTRKLPPPRGSVSVVKGSQTATKTGAEPALPPAPRHEASRELRPDGVGQTHLRAAQPQFGAVEPLAADRYKVQFTAGAAFRDKLKRLQDLSPGCDVAQVIEQAVTERLERLEAKRFARVKKPRKSLKDTDTTPSSRYIPAPVRRAVHERDGGRCTFRDESGRRCTARSNLEFHHHGRPYGRGGEHSTSNVRLMCAAQRPAGRARLRAGRHGALPAIPFRRLGAPQRLRRLLEGRASTAETPRCDDRLTAMGLPRRDTIAA